MEAVILKPGDHIELLALGQGREREIGQVWGSDCSDKAAAEGLLWPRV